jgi:regulator of nucleoside diphosphate kinase
MTVDGRVWLTERDFEALRRLKVTLTRPGGVYASLLDSKLERAVVVDPAALEDEIVTIGSRITYSVDGRRKGPFVLSEEPEAFSIHTLHGLALLGVAVGRQVTLYLGDDDTEELVVESVETPPNYGRASSPATASGAKVIPIQFGRRRPIVPGPGEDDPGPSAA